MNDSKQRPCAWRRNIAVMRLLRPAQAAPPTRAEMDALMRRGPQALPAPRQPAYAERVARGRAREPMQCGPDPGETPSSLPACWWLCGGFATARVAGSLRADTRLGGSARCALLAQGG